MFTISEIELIEEIYRKDDFDERYNHPLIGDVCIAEYKKEKFAIINNMGKIISLPYYIKEKDSAIDYLNDLKAFYNRGLSMGIASKEKEIIECLGLDNIVEKIKEELDEKINDINYKINREG